MFLRRYRRTKNGKTHTYYAIVESVRTQAGPRQRVVAHLGSSTTTRNADGNAPSGSTTSRARIVNSVYSRTTTSVSSPDDPDIVRINLKSVGWANPRQFGDVWLALWSGRHLKLDEIIDRHVPQGQETIRPADIVAIEVINRLCSPCSEFALAEHWYASTGLEDLLGVPDRAVTKDRLYRTLDRLLKAQDGDRARSQETTGHVVSTRLQPGALRPHQYVLRRMAAENELATEDTPAITERLQADRRGLVVTKDGFPWHTAHCRQHPRLEDRSNHRRRDRNADRHVPTHLGHGPRHDQRRVVEVPR